MPIEATEKKATEFASLYDQFKTLQAELTQHTSSLQKDDNDLHRINVDLEKEKNNTSKLNDNINDNNKKFDSENQQFTGKLKEFQQLVISTKQQILILQKSHAEIKLANEELQKKEALYLEHEKQNAHIAENLKQAEARLAEFNNKFKSFIEHLRSLSETIPQLKSILENLDSKN